VCLQNELASELAGVKEGGRIALPEPVGTSESRKRFGYDCTALSFTRHIFAQGTSSRIESGISRRAILFPKSSRGAEVLAAVALHEREFFFDGPVFVVLHAQGYPEPVGRGSGFFRGHKRSAAVSEDS
jgi:hypothetical protein